MPPPFIVRRAEDDFSAYIIGYAAERVGATVVSVVCETLPFSPIDDRARFPHLFVNKRWHVYIRTNGIATKVIDDKADELSAQMQNRREDYWQ